MGWIKNRIDSEFKKHKDLDWSRIAETKIISQINEIVDEKFEELGKWIEAGCDMSADSNDLKKKIRMFGVQER